MKKIISIIMAVLVVALIVLSVIKPEGIDDMKNGNNEHINNAEGNNSWLEEELKYKNPQFGDIVTMRIDSSKIVPMHTPVIIEFRTQKLEYCVDNAYYSRELPKEYEAKSSYIKYFGNDVMDEQGKLLKDWYYIVVDITVGNPEDETFALTMKDTGVIFIDDSGMATDNTKIKKDAFYCREIPEQRRFGTMKDINDFQPGEKVSYQSVYIVQEQEIVNDDVYIRADYGLRGERALGNSMQRYIRLELEEK